MQDNNIGSLNEHTLHLALKKYIEPDTDFHEVEYKGYIVDIKRGNDIYEIETRSFSNVARKMAAFLEECRVTVVYPIGEMRWVIWIDPKTGEMSERRRSTKKGRASDVFSELYKIKEYISHPNFSLKLIFIEEEQYKKRIGKRGGRREERIPIGFISERDCRHPEDYVSLVDVLPTGEFTAEEFGRTNKLRCRNAWYALKVLITVGAIEKVGQNGRTFIYRASENLF